MKALVDYGHSLGLKVGSYLNNCICMETWNKSPDRYKKDVAWFTEMGFDGVKIDNCGSSKNVTEYAHQFNLTGRPVRIEACHNDAAKFDQDGNFVCPMNQYRSGGDIGPNFGSIIGEAYGTIGHNDLDVPMSRPGCW